MKVEQLTDVQYHKLLDAKAIAQSLMADVQVNARAAAAVAALVALLCECDKHARREEAALPW